jgi:hypothetical protein
MTVVVVKGNGAMHEKVKNIIQFFAFCASIGIIGYGIATDDKALGFVGLMVLAGGIFQSYGRHG